MEQTIALKKLTWDMVHTCRGTLIDLLLGPCEIVRIGALDDLKQYADEHGLVWSSHPNMLFQGYWVDSDGNSYIPY